MTSNKVEGSYWSKTHKLEVWDAFTAYSSGLMLKEVSTLISRFWTETNSAKVNMDRKECEFIKASTG